MQAAGRLVCSSGVLPYSAINMSTIFTKARDRAGFEGTDETAVRSRRVSFAQASFGRVSRRCDISSRGDGLNVGAGTRYLDQIVGVGLGGGEVWAFITRPPLSTWLWLFPRLSCSCDGLFCAPSQHLRRAHHFSLQSPQVPALQGPTWPRSFPAASVVGGVVTPAAAAFKLLFGSRPLARDVSFHTHHTPLRVTEFMLGMAEALAALALQRSFRGRVIFYHHIMPTELGNGTFFGDFWIARNRHYKVRRHFAVLLKAPVRAPREELHNPLDTDAKGCQFLSGNVLSHAATQILNEKSAAALLLQ